MILPLGFTYSATYAGIRKTAKNDLALIVSATAADAAAVFTTNRVQAAPVVLARKNLAASKGKVRAVMINAGNANCATRTGEKVAADTCRALAKAIGCPPSQILPASTGVIGVELDGRLITEALPAAMKKLGSDNFDAAAEAIMTTDLVPKTAGVEVKVKGGVARLAGFTKGSGMIQPNMATTLGFVMTDATVPPPVLKKMLSRTIARSYNRISVDGDTSTNDVVAILANGASGIKPTGTDLQKLEAGLGEVLESLARQIAKDGEGAKRLITIDVTGARSEAEAEKIGRAVANSPLVKTAMAGADPNWGRIIAAGGYSGANFDPGQVDIHLQDVLVCRRGLAADFSETALKAKLNAPEITIRFVIRGDGKGTARFWSCDFTEGYIRINGSYRT